VALANRAARELLGVAPGELLAETLAATPGLQPVAEFLAAGVNELRQATVKLAPAGGEEREWSLVWVPIAGAGDPASLLVVEDATEVLRGQRLAAWAEMARLIAHEIKNPLTPIRLSTEHLREAWHRDREHFAEVFERCTDNILRQVEELRAIAGEFSTYSQIPRLERQPGDLARTVAEVVAGYRSSAMAGVPVEVVAEPASVPCRFDPRLLARAVRNLIENAVRASGQHGRVRVAVEADDLEARVIVADRGPGVPEELLPRIFEPYFSTHAGGTGLGLPIARRIAEEHGGSLAARNLAGGGLEVTITIPR
jgi:two-component system nitrogen regulation sensor histidine kinase NtrY